MEEANTEAHVRSLQRLLLEKERECEMYVALAANRFSPAGAQGTEGDQNAQNLRHALAERLGIPLAGISDSLFDGLVLKECEALLASRTELQRRNLTRRGHDSPERAAAARRGAAFGHSDAAGGSSDGAEPSSSELTTAVGNINKVFDLMLKRRRPTADGDPPANELLHQWDVLSGVMEDQKLRQLLALDGMSLPDCYTVIDNLFATPDKPQAKGGGGKGAAVSVPDAPPIDRKRFETFFTCRHLGLSDALQAQMGGKAPAGGEAVKPNLAAVRWQDILALGEQIVGLQQAFDDTGIAHEDFLPESALAGHVAGQVQMMASEGAWPPGQGMPGGGMPPMAHGFLPAHSGAMSGHNPMMPPPGMVFHPHLGWVPAQPGAPQPYPGYAFPSPQDA